VGELFGTDRDRFVVMTKYAVTVDGSDPNPSGNQRKSLVRSLEESLTRMRTEYIDLLWVHVWDPLTPVEEAMRALDDVVRARNIHPPGEQGPARIRQIGDGDIAERDLRIAREVGAVADELGVTSSQVALAWPPVEGVQPIRRMPTIPRAPGAGTGLRERLP
jgi:aryl-alcohol dehydrogenase-like predicted oxidoreductase